MSENKEENKSYEALYKYSKEVYEEELKKFSRIDDKATKFLAILTALVGGYSLLGRQIFSDIIPPHNNYDWFSLISGLLVFIGLIVTGVLIFRVIKLADLKKVDLSNEMLVYFKDNNINSIHEGLSWNYKESYEHNLKATEKKTRLLTVGYYSIGVTIAFFILFVISNVVNEWNTNNGNTSLPTSIKGEAMSEKNVNPAPPPKAPEPPPKEVSQPQPAVMPPSPRIAQESYQPPQKPK